MNKNGQKFRRLNFLRNSFKSYLRKFKLKKKSWDAPTFKSHGAMTFSEFLLCANKCRFCCGPLENWKFSHRPRPPAGNRRDQVLWEMTNIKAAAKLINRRVRYNNNGRFGYERVMLKLGEAEYPMTLISYKDKRNKDIMFFLTNGRIKLSKEIARRIRGYFRRWGVEECYRFEKQGSGIEKLIVRSYRGIKTLLGLSLLSWLVLIKINGVMPDYRGLYFLFFIVKF